MCSCETKDRIIGGERVKERYAVFPHSFMINRVITIGDFTPNGEFCWSWGKNVNLGIVTFYW